MRWLWRNNEMEMEINEFYMNELWLLQQKGKRSIKQLRMGSVNEKSNIFLAYFLLDMYWSSLPD